MDKYTIAVLTVFITPIVATTVAFIVNNLGLSGKLRQAEYYVKRLNIVRELLTLEKNAVKDFHLQYDKELLRTEISEIFEYIRQTSHRKAEEEEQVFQKRSFPKRVFFIPKPRSISGWIGTIIYYLYLWTALVYFVMLIYGSFTGYDSDFGPSTIIAVLIGSLIFAYLGRSWAMRSYKTWLKQVQTIIADAKIQTN